MITNFIALDQIPIELRDPLILEYQSIVRNFLEHRWLPSELSGGRFSEVAYTIVSGQAEQKYAKAPAKPRNFVQACQKLENNVLPHVPRSFQILVPRILPALYEIRNNRNVGHLGGDVDPNQMDAVAVLSMCNWIMGEFVRVYHGLAVEEAQKIVDALADIRIPVVWTDGTTKRVLQPALKIPDQLLLLIATTMPEVSVTQLLAWSEVSDKAYFVKLLRSFHKQRLIEFHEASAKIRILPPGSSKAQGVLQRITQI